MAQRDEEWFAKRAGAFTASRSGDLMAKTRTGPAAARRNLITLLAVERLTGQCVETYQNAAMARGIEMEPEARDAYSFETGSAVDQVDFIQHPTIPRCGCSPDGLVGSDGMVELKCPTSMTVHYEALTGDAHADQYRWQLQHQLMVAGREWVDIASYHPSFPPGLQLAVKRIFRNAEDIEELTAAILQADGEVEDTLKSLRQLQERAA